MPASGAPPTIGEMPTVASRRPATVFPIPGTDRMGRSDAMGFDGQSTTTSAASMASSTPGAGRAASTPWYRIALTSSRARRFTQYSWKCRSSCSPSATTVTRVATGSSLIGMMREPTPNRRAMSAEASDNVAPARSRFVRYRWVARSRSPRLNQAWEGSNRPSSPVARNVSSRRPHPRSRSMVPASQ